VQVETRDVEGPVRWILSGLWLDFVLAESEGPPRWQVVSHAANAATFQIGGTLRSELCPEVQALTPEQWKDDLRIRAALASELPPPEPEPSPAPSSAPAPRDPAVAAAPSVASPLLDPADSRAQLEKWAEEDRDRQGRVDAFRERLPEISGPTEVTERAKAFLAEVDVWLAEARTQVERIARDLERPGATLALPDRSKVNILYFRAHRNLVMVKDLLPASLD
jgi:hypothetical protein